MKRHSLPLFALIAGLFASTSHANTILADFVKAEVAPDSTVVPLPYFLMNNATDVVFLKFKIPNFSEIWTINFFLINVVLYDDADGGGEMGEIDFALPGDNLPLVGFVNLNHTTSSSPAVASIPLCDCEIEEVRDSILEDGNFRIKIKRFTGDFFLAGGSAILDVTPLPEPGPMTAVAAGLLGLAWFGRRRRPRWAITRPSASPEHGAQ